MSAEKTVKTCPHNEEVVCESYKCNNCGWNPKVARARYTKITGGVARMPNDKLYRVPFTGYVEVWADSKEEAEDLAEDFSTQFFAHYEYGEAECTEKEDEDE